MAEFEIPRQITVSENDSALTICSSMNTSSILSIDVIVSLSTVDGTGEFTISLHNVMS